MIDMQGKRFGRLTVVEFAGFNKRHSATWKCVCDCGNTKIIDGNSLRKGHTKSCGCYNKDMHVLHPNRTTHGMCHSRIYNIWQKMKTRCNDKNDRLYGGRGISVCDEWLDFMAFYDWAMKNGYNDTLSIDRIDVDGNYYPENCRWVSNKVQANNKRNNRPITINGVTHNVLEWSRIYGISYQSVWRKMKQGITGEDLFIKKRGGDKPCGIQTAIKELSPNYQETAESHSGSV